MKKFSFVVSLMACLMFATDAVASRNGYGDIVTCSHDVAPFMSVCVMGPITVVYSQGSKQSVTVSASSKYIDKVVVSVENKCLTVSLMYSSMRRVFSHIDDIVVSVTTPDIVGAQIMGSGSFVAKGLVDTDVMELDVVGSGDIMVGNLQCDRLNVAVKGSGDVALKRVRMLNGNLSIAGSGDINANFVESGGVVCSVTGSGDITVSGDVSSFRQTTTGSGDIHSSALNTRSSAKSIHR